MYREVMGRPAYQHRDLPSRWLVWTGVMWLGLLTEDLPWGYGIRMEAGMSDFDRAQDERPQTPTLSLQEDVAGPDQGRGAVVELRGVRGRDRAVLLEGTS